MYKTVLSPLASRWLPTVPVYTVVSLSNYETLRTVQYFILLDYINILYEENVWCNFHIISPCRPADRRTGERDAGHPSAEWSSRPVHGSAVAHECMSARHERMRLCLHVSTFAQRLSSVSRPNSPNSEIPPFAQEVRGTLPLVIVAQGDSLLSWVSLTTR